MKRIIKGYRPLCYLGTNILLMSKRNILFSYDISKDSFDKIISFNISFLLLLLSHFSLTRRLFRIEYRYGIEIDIKRYLLVFRNKILILDLNDNTLKAQEINERGLSFVKIADVNGFDDMICFGEYKENFSKDEISIHSLINNQWKIVYTFKKGEIEHVHAIIPDPINSRIWILTGDFGDSACIWLAEENFSKVKPVARGGQMFRACVAFPFNGGLLYATDSQIEENSINFLQPNNNGEFEIKVIGSINGPCIYGTQIKDNFIFSTAIEPYNGLEKIDIIKGLLSRRPGKGIKSPNSEVLMLNREFELKTLSSNEKDIFPFIFQFGTITFPTDNHNSENLTFYNIGLKNNNNCTEIWSFKH
jgi:hypothetical protein